MSVPLNYHQPIDQHVRYCARSAMTAICAAVLVSMTSCNKTESQQSTTQPPSAASLPAPKMVVSEENADQEKLCERTKSLFRQRDFNALDKLAHELREAKQILPNGAWALRSFYSGVEAISDDAPDDQWESLLGTLKEWIKTKPESITPRVALAEVLVSYAWKARGTDYADTITEKGAKLMEERLAMAHSSLGEARKLEEKCPRWWPAAQDAALGEGMEMDAYDKLCEEGLSVYPENQIIYLYKAYFLQPRWYGEEGQWEKFAADSAEKIGGKEGDILYARIIWYLDGKHFFRNIFSDSKVRWERVKRSFDALLSKYPDSLGVMSEFARLACNAADWAKARELFLRIGGRVDSAVWSKTEDFLRYRDDAFAHQ